MTLLEVAIITGTSFNERRNTMGYIFSLHSIEVKDGSLLISSYGSGKTLLAAKRDYAKQLQSKTIVINARRHDRRAVLLPPKITSN